VFDLLKNDIVWTTQLNCILFDFYIVYATRHIWGNETDKS